MHKHVIHALLTFWKFLSRKIIKLHLNFNLHTTLSINAVNLFIHCTISIVYLDNYNDYIILNFEILGDVPGPPPPLPPSI